MAGFFDDFSTEPPRKRVIAPRPGPGKSVRPALRRVSPPPPTLGNARRADAVYLLDANVGFAFAHVNRLQLLADHYGAQLQYTNMVLVEWEYRAESDHRPGQQGETPEGRDGREQHNRLRTAGARLIDQVEDLFGPPIELDGIEAQSILNLRDELVDLTNAPRPKGRDHMGECESVRYGEQLLAQGKEVVILCSNDAGAQLLAYNHSIAKRNMWGVLEEMAVEGRVSEQDIKALYLDMAQVTKLPDAQRPA